MAVDKLGLHCIVISDFELFYMNWKSDKVFPMSNIEKDGSTVSPIISIQSRYIVDNRPCSITTVDIATEENEQDVFDIVFGTKDGRVYHAEIIYESGELQFSQKFECIIKNIPNNQSI